MIPDVGDVQEVVVRERVLHSCHPLLHIRRTADRIGHWVEPESHVRQRPQGVACRHDFARKGTRQSQGCISAERRGWIQSIIEARDPRGRL